MLTLLSGCVMSLSSGLLSKPLSLLDYVCVCVNFNIIINFLIKFSTRILTSKTKPLGQILQKRKRKILTKISLVGTKMEWNENERKNEI